MAIGICFVSDRTVSERSELSECCANSKLALNWHFILTAVLLISVYIHESRHNFIGMILRKRSKILAATPPDPYVNITHQNYVFSSSIAAC